MKALMRCCRVAIAVSISSAVINSMLTRTAAIFVDLFGAGSMYAFHGGGRNA
jgi:hypothetical protein